MPAADTDYVRCDGRRASAKYRTHVVIWPRKQHFWCLMANAERSCGSAHNTMSAIGQKKKAGIHCDKCDTYIPNEASLEAHLKGKKHIKNVERIKNWEQMAGRSLYIAGIDSCSAAELELADYFSQFGNIAKITVDKNLGHFAILEFSDEGSAAKALEIEDHFLGSRQITVKPREVKVPTAKKETATGHIVHNQMPPGVWKAMMDCNNVNEQFSTLHEHLSLTEDDIHLRDLVCKLLRSALVEVFPSCEVQPFGSSVNGFGTHGCDLDLNFCYTKLDYNAAIQFLPRSDNPLVANDMSHQKDLTDKQIIIVIAEIIKQCVPDCHKVKAILTARRPVVKFCHNVSEMQCDISVGNALAVRNTMLLRRFCSDVPYLSPLVQAVRQWMKHWNLAGSRLSAGPHLNNYAVTLMVLFYLQNCDPQELERLEAMRSKDTSLQPCTIDGWDCSIPGGSPLHHTSSSCDLQQLFSGFFHYYSKIDFSENVLCLKSGNLQKISVLKDSMQGNGLPPQGGRVRSFKYGALNVRDPFELCHNVAGNVGRKHMLIFMKCLRNAALASAMKLYSKKSGNQREAWGVLNLFIDHHKKTPEKKPRKYSSGNSTYVLDIVKKTQKLNWTEDTASLVLVVLKDIFMMNVVSNGSSEGALQEHCLDGSGGAATQCVAVDVPSDRGQVDTGSFPEGSEGVRKRPHADSPVHSKRTRIDLGSPEAGSLKFKAKALGKTLQLPILLKCEAVHRVWEGRRKARRHLVQPGLSSLLDLERQVSKLLLSESINSGESDTSLLSNSSAGSAEVHFHFHLNIEKSSDDLIRLSFTHDLTDSLNCHDHQEFQNFFHHFETFLPNIVAKCSKAD